MRPLGLAEISRTGIVAIASGRQTITDLLNKGT